MRKNDIFTGECTGYTSDALGVVKSDGRVIFVKNLLAGERCEVRVLKVGSNVSYGRVERIITPSPHRVAPNCPIYGKCGGCGVRHMDRAEELRFKCQKVNDALQRIGGLDLTVGEILTDGEVTGYRNKTIYTVGRENGKIVTGFYRPRTHELVSAPDCALESEYAKRAAAALRDAMNRFNIPCFDDDGHGVRRLFCRFGTRSREGQIVIVTGSGNLRSLRGLIDALRHVDGTVGVLRSINGSRGDTVLGDEYETLWGRGYINDTLCGLNFRLTPDSFYQVNTPIAERLYMKAVEYAELRGDTRLLDLYCGTGTMTQIMSRYCEEATGVEIVGSAVESARASARENGIENVRFICSDAADALRGLTESGSKPDVVVVNPPRKGLATNAPELIASMEPQRVVYMSCNPATLARDLRIFADCGYYAAKAVAGDMFPGTACVETVVLMSRVKD